MAVDIKVDAIPPEKTLTMMRKFGKQLPFAESVAINKTAFLVQDKEISNIEDGRFNLRSKWYQKRKRFGVNVKPSNKRNLLANIFSRAAWLEKQEKGGTKVGSKKTPLVGGSKLLMPAKDIRKKKTRLIPKKFSPAKLLANPKKNRVFFVDTPGGGLILQRKGKGKNSKARVIFFVEDRARVPAVLEFEKTGQKVVNKVYRKEFGKALAFAIATAGGNLKKDT